VVLWAKRAVVNRRAQKILVQKKLKNAVNLNLVKKKNVETKIVKKKLAQTALVKKNPNVILEGV
jgi:hypothetical protein